jgi:hypothetical protein
VVPALIASVALLAGCGGASHRSASSGSASPSSTTPTTSTATSAAAPTVATICTARARDAIARFLHATPASLPQRGATANSSYPECVTAARLGGRRVTVTAEVDTEPDAYAVLERTIIESSQIFPQRNHPAPQHVDGLGLDASWFPESGQLMTTDAVRLIIATIGWPRVPTARRVALGTAVARTYLGRSQPKLARGPAP